MKLLKKPIAGLPWITMILCCCSLLLFLFPGAAPDALVYNRQAVAGGEVWRLFSAHFVHCDFSHLSMNLAALFILGSLLEQEIGKKLFGVVLISCLGVSGWLWFVETDLQLYCGLSGILNGLLAVLLVRLWQKEKHLLLPLIGAASLLKIVIESVNQQALFSHLSWASVPGAHGAGFAAGILYLVVYKFFFCLLKDIYLRHLGQLRVHCSRYNHNSWSRGKRLQNLAFRRLSRDA